jgi:hypothetical protein
MVNIRKKEQFSAFIKYLEEGSACHWVQIANALNVDKDTITEWRKDERAQEAIKKGINYALINMEKSGKRDWRMWQAKLNMLGITQIDRTDITSGYLPIPILDVVHQKEQQAEK